MDNQTRNHLNLQKHIADQDHIIRVRNAEIAALRKRAEKAEQPRPLTADDITDEMIDRAYAWWEGNTLAHRTTPRRIHRQEPMT